MFSWDTDGQFCTFKQQINIDIIELDNTDDNISNQQHICFIWTVYLWVIIYNQTHFFLICGESVFVTFL